MSLDSGQPAEANVNTDVATTDGTSQEIHDRKEEYTESSDAAEEKGRLATTSSIGKDEVGIEPTLSEERADSEPCNASDDASHTDIAPDVANGVKSGDDASADSNAAVPDVTATIDATSTKDSESDIQAAYHSSSETNKVDTDAAPAEASAEKESESHEPAEPHQVDNDSEERDTAAVSPEPGPEETSITLGQNKELSSPEKTADAIEAVEKRAQAPEPEQQGAAPEVAEAFESWKRDRFGFFMYVCVAFCAFPIMNIHMFCL